MTEEEWLRRLEAVDFSVESRARESLRERLLARPSRRPRPWAQLVVAFAAAALLVVVGLRGFRGQEPAPRYAAGEHGLPVLPGRLEPPPAARAEPVFETAPTSLSEIFGKPELEEAR